MVRDKTAVLKAGVRKEEKVNQLRSEDKLPGVIYGEGLKKSIPLIFSYGDFSKLIDKVGKGSLIKIDIDGKEKDVIIQAVQRNPLTDKFIHADFMAVDLNKEVEVQVALEYVGETLTVKEQGGTLVQGMDHVNLKCKAKDIPDKIEVDISTIKTFDDVIYLKDIVLPENVELLDNIETVVANVTEPRTEQEMEALEEEAAEDVKEVEGVEKEEEEKEGEEEGEEEKPEEEKAEGEEDKKEEVKKEE